MVEADASLLPTGGEFAGFLSIPAKMAVYEIGWDGKVQQSQYESTTDLMHHLLLQWVPESYFRQLLDHGKPWTPKEATAAVAVQMATNSASDPVVRQMATNLDVHQYYVPTRVAGGDGLPLGVGRHDMLAPVYKHNVITDAIWQQKYGRQPERTNMNLHDLRTLASQHSSYITKVSPKIVATLLSQKGQLEKMQAVLLRSTQEKPKARYYMFSPNSGSRPTYHPIGVPDGEWVGSKASFPCYFIERGGRDVIAVSMNGRAHMTTHSGILAVADYYTNLRVVEVPQEYAIAFQQECCRAGSTNISVTAAYRIADRHPLVHPVIMEFNDARFFVTYKSRVDLGAGKSRIPTGDAPMERTGGNDASTMVAWKTPTENHDAGLFWLLKSGRLVAAEGFDGGDGDDQKVFDANVDLYITQQRLPVMEVSRDYAMALFKAGGTVPIGTAIDWMTKYGEI
jgi:hypothetical protein